MSAALSALGSGLLISLIIVGSARAIWWLAGEIVRHKEKIMAGKRYGTKKLLTTELPFELEIVREIDGVDTVETLEFTARPRVSAGDMIAMGVATTGEETTAAVRRILDRALSDRDGVPAGWHPVELPQPTDTGSDWEPVFRAPGGELEPMANAGKYLALEAGSSRRRWRYLMDEDHTATVEMKDLTEIVRDLIAAASARPTDA